MTPKDAWILLETTCGTAANRPTEVARALLTCSHVPLALLPPSACSGCTAETLKATVAQQTNEESQEELGQQAVDGPTSTSRDQKRLSLCELPTRETLQVLVAMASRAGTRRVVIMEPTRWHVDGLRVASAGHLDVQPWSGKVSLRDVLLVVVWPELETELRLAARLCLTLRAAGLVVLGPPLAPEVITATGMRLQQVAMARTHTIDGEFDERHCKQPGEALLRPSVQHLLLPRYVGSGDDGNDKMTPEIPLPFYTMWRPGPAQGRAARLLATRLHVLGAAAATSMPACQEAHALVQAYRSSRLPPAAEASLATALRLCSRGEVTALWAAVDSYCRMTPETLRAAHRAGELSVCRSLLQAAGSEALPHLQERLRHLATVTACSAGLAARHCLVCGAEVDARSAVKMVACRRPCARHLQCG